MIDETTLRPLARLCVETGLAINAIQMVAESVNATITNALSSEVAIDGANRLLGELDRSEAALADAAARCNAAAPSVGDDSKPHMLALASSLEKTIVGMRRNVTKLVQTTNELRRRQTEELRGDEWKAR